MKLLLMKKSRTDKKSGRAGSPENQLEYFRGLLLAHLDSLEDGGPMMKGGKGLPVGTIRDWKGGRKYIKVGPNKWRPKYGSESRGAKMAIAAIKRKVNAAQTAKELMDIVMENRDRFSDAQGNPLPFIQELSGYVSLRGDKIEDGKKETMLDRLKRVTDELYEDDAGKERERAEIRKEQKTANMKKKPEISGGAAEKNKEFVKNRIKEENKKLSAAKNRLKKVKSDNQEKFDAGNLKPGEGMRLNMSEASAVRNAEYHKNTLAKLLEEAKQLGIDTQETDKEQNNLYQAGDYQVKQRGENDFVVTDKEGNVLSRFTPLTPSGQSDTFNDIKWAKRDADLRAKMDKEAKTKKPPDPEQLKKLAEMAEEEKNAYNSAMIELFRNGMISEKEAVAKLTGRKNRNRKTAAEARKLLGLEKPAEQKTADMDGGLFNKKNQNTEKDGGRSDFAKIREKYQSAKAAGGDEDEIAVGKEAVSGKWKLVEADTPAASHDEQTFRKTPGFPANDDGSTINDRDYERDKAAQEAVLEIAAGYDMRALSFDSPVIVTKDGIVISGNNRTMSSKIAARKGTDKKYIEALKKKAGKFGFTEKDVAAFRNPRVVFEIDHNEGYSTEQFAKFNESGKKAMSPIESAVKVSKMIRTKTVGSIAGRIAEFETLGELYADKKAAHDIFNTLQQDGIIGQFDRPQYITDDGITGAGKEFLETVLIGSVINEQNIRGLNREGCKSIRQKLVRAITPLIENKGMDGYSITKELNEAVDIAMQVAIQKDKFKNVDDFSKQHTMFEKLNPVSVEFAKKLEETQKGFAEFMQAMNGGLKYAANGEADIFVGGVESREQILDRVLGLQKAINKAIDGALRFFRGLSKGRGSFDREKVILNRAGGNAEGFRRVMKKAKPDVMLALEKQAAAPHAELIQEAGSGEKTIAIDFDGVINSYTSGWQGPTKTDEPVLSAAEGISGLWNRGHTIIIFSTRANTPEGADTIREYIRRHTENNLLADSIEITDRKPIADVYVDGRAIPFNGNREETSERIETFEPWTGKSLTYSGYPLQGRTKIHGMDISIENRKGGARSGVDKDGHEWHTKMHYDYGYIRGTVGVDKDHLDAYVGPSPESEIVYIVNQNDPVTGDFDEQKVMLGFNSEAEAKAAYLKQYDRPGFFGDIVKMDIDTFKEEAFNPGNKGKPIKRREN